MREDRLYRVYARLQIEPDVGGLLGFELPLSQGRFLVARGNRVPHAEQTFALNNTGCSTNGSKRPARLIAGFPT